MTREDKVPTVDVLAVDGEPKARDYFDDSSGYLQSGDGVVEFWIAPILWISRWKNCHYHSDGSIPVQKTDYQANAPYQN